MGDFFSVQGEFDADTYMKTIVSIAYADGVLHEKEKEYILTQAEVNLIDPSSYLENPPKDLSFLDDKNIPKFTAMSIIRDCIVLSCIEGEFDDSERNQIDEIAKKLGVSPVKVAELEDWLKDYWEVVERGKALFEG